MAIKKTTTGKGKHYLSVAQGAGKPYKQAVAISMSVAKTAKKKAGKKK